MNVSSKLFGGFIFIVSITILLGITAFINSTQIGTSFKFLVEHDLNVLQNAQKLQKLVVDAETGQRGFVITGDENFLEPYYNGVNGFYELIQVEKELVSDNPPQVEKLEKIEKLFGDWQENAAIPEITLARMVHGSDASFHDLEVLLVEGTGKDILDELRVLLDELLDHTLREDHIEQQLLLRQISKDLVDRETGQRGFLITGEDEFLEPYNLGNENLDTHLSQLLKLVQEEEEPEEVEEEIARVNKIVALAHKWKVEAGIPEIEKRKIINENPTIFDVATLLQAETGKDLLDQIRAEFAEFNQIENELKDERFQTALEIESNMKTSVIVLTIASLASGVIVSVLLFRTIIRPIIKLDVASSEMAKGNLDVKIATKGNDEISHLNKSFATMRDSIKDQVKNERLTAIGELSASIAHDIRNPLFVIKNSNTLMEKIVHDEKGLIEIRRIDRSVARITHQLNQVLDFIRTSPLKLEQFSLTGILDVVIKILEIPPNISINMPQDDFEILIDRSKMESVFYNILYNAIQAIGNQKGTITIKISDEVDMIKIDFENDGPNMSDEVLPKIFDPLFTTKQKGTGLGLSAAKNSIVQHGGTISVTNNPVVFTIKLPKAKNS